MRSFLLAHYMLGTEGLALMRSWASDDRAAAAWVREISAICQSLDQPPQATRFVVDEVTPSQGYAVWSETYDQGQDTNPLIVLERPVLQRLLIAAPPGRALDAACGTGQQTQRLAARGHEVIGVDMTPEMLERARERVPQARFILGDVRALPLETASIDLVVCTRALTHLPDLSPAIGEFARVLRPGGQIVLSDIHPMLVAYGGHPLVRVEGDRFAMIRNHLHLHAEYLHAFIQARLVVRECIEPLYTPEAAALEPGAAAIPEAAAAAFVGTPAVLMWDLRKPE